MQLNSTQTYRLLALAGMFAIFLMPYHATAAETRHKWAQELEKGCERGSMPDCLDLAVSYARGDHKGKKVEKDRNLMSKFATRAVELGTNGCRQGNLKYCYNLGVLYFEGELVGTDHQKGIEHTRKACTGGYKEACDWLLNSGL